MGLQVHTVSNAWAKIRQELLEAKKSHVAVGWPSESPKTRESHDSILGMSNVQVATANEVGSAPGVRPKVPARPMVAETMRRIELPAKKLTADLLKMVTEDKMTVRAALGRIGRYAQGEVKKSIRMPAGGWKAENAKTTIALKSKKGKVSDIPLVDTGNLFKSVTYAVRMRGKK